LNSGQDFYGYQSQMILDEKKCGKNLIKPYLYRDSQYLKNSNAKFWALAQGDDSVSSPPVAPAQNQISMSHIQNRIEI
jgi:hypothetical protein